VAANPQDRTVFCTGEGLIVLTWGGGVFGHRFEGDHGIGPAFRYDGPPVAAQPVDHHLLIDGTKIYVITNDGRVFQHPTAGFGTIIK
jgi:hypothetical protein